MPDSRTALSLAVLCGAALAAGAFANHVPGHDPMALGTDVGAPGVLCEINMDNLATQVITDAGIPFPEHHDPDNQPNAQGWDHVNQRFFYARALGGDLYVWIDTGDGTPNDDHHYLGNVEHYGLPPDTDDLTPEMASAAFYDGRYFFVVDETDDLWQVTFLPTASPPFIEIDSVTKVADLAGNARGWRFGDIAIDHGVLFGSGQRTDNGEVELFRYEVVDPDNPCCFFSIKSEAAAVYPLLQLTFDPPMNMTLYGFDSLDGMSYTVDRFTGEYTVMGMASPLVRFRDVGGFPVMLQSFTINGE